MLLQTVTRKLHSGIKGLWPFLSLQKQMPSPEVSLVTVQSSLRIWLDPNPVHCQLLYSKRLSQRLFSRMEIQFSSVFGMYYLDTQQTEITK